MSHYVVSYVVSYELINVVSYELINVVSYGGVYEAHCAA